MELQIAKRRLTFIARVVSIDQSKVRGILISAWIGKQKTLKLSLLNDVKTNYPINR